MNSIERRMAIEKRLLQSNTPEKGQILAKDYGVTRQVIVKDIAILRAEGKNIIATPEGYIIQKNDENRIIKVVALCHRTEDIKDELECIIKFGGVVKDVIVEHPLYGEIRGMLMIKTLYDIENFITKIIQNKAEPLMILTAGVHLHTIEANNEDTMNKILKQLNVRGYLVID